MPKALEKLSDRKLVQPVFDMLTLFCEAKSPKFVVNIGLRYMGKIKAPKMLQEFLGWIKIIAEEFGARRVELRSVIDFVKGKSL